MTDFGLSFEVGSVTGYGQSAACAGVEIAPKPARLSIMVAVIAESFFRLRFILIPSIKGSVANLLKDVRRVRLTPKNKQGCTHTSYKQISLYIEFVKAVSRVVTNSLPRAKRFRE